MSQKWLMPANPKIYDLDNAVRELKEIPWTTKTKFETGDEVYVYVSKPQGYIKYKAIAIGPIKASDKPDEHQYWQDKAFEEASQSKDGVVLRFTTEFKKPFVTYEDLKSHGLKGVIQSARRFGPISLNDTDRLNEWADYVLSQEAQAEMIEL